MDINNPRSIREESEKSIAAVSGTKRLVLLYGGVLMGVNFLLVLVRFILGREIGDAEGLAAMDLRTLLKTVQTVLDFASTLLAAFWEAGFVYVAIQVFRRHHPGNRDMLRGFYRFGPIFLILLLQSLVMNIIAVFCIQVSAFIFMATPMSADFKVLVEPLLTQGPEAVMDAVSSQAILGELIPMILVFAALYLVIFLPLLYRFRMAAYLAVDEPGQGAMGALMGSWQMTKGNCGKLFRLDLGFWWFYLAQALLTVVCYGDTVLGMLHVKLPMAADAASLLFYGIYVVLNLAFLYAAKLKVETAYAGAYECLRREPAALPDGNPYA